MDGGGEGENGGERKQSVGHKAVVNGQAMKVFLVEHARNHKERGTPSPMD